MPHEVGSGDSRSRSFTAGYQFAHHRKEALIRLWTSNFSAKYVNVGLKSMFCTNQMEKIPGSNRNEGVCVKTDGGSAITVSINIIFTVE